MKRSSKGSLNFSRALFFALALISTSLHAGNPINWGDWPDPHATVLDGKYWIFPTAAHANGTAQQFHAFSSTDLISWSDEGTIFDLDTEVTWTDDNGWAPAMAFRNGTYYFYYTANGPYPDSKIGVASAASPTGPFTDHGVIAESSDTVEAIDPMVFVDDDGKAYLYYGGSAGSALAIQELAEDMVTKVGNPITTQTPSYFTEAPFVHKRKGTYYLTYSNGSYSAPKGASDEYNVRYATSTSPTGPWTYQGKLLYARNTIPDGADDPDRGPGHNSILQRPGTDEWYIVYHRWEDDDRTGRRMAIEPLQYNTDGTLQTVIMTSTGVTTAAEPRLPGGTYRIISKKSGKALDRLYCSTSDETNIIQYSALSTNLDCQKWDVELLDATNSEYAIRLDIGGGNWQSLDRHTCSTANETNVKLYQWGTWNDPCQRWKIVATGDNAFKIVAKDASGQGLDVDGCSVNDGANIKMYEYWGGDCQRWRFEPVQ